MLFGDQLASHKNPNMVANALAHHVMCWLLPVSCTHFLQPLDATAFACFKQENAVNKVAAKLSPDMTTTEHQMTMYEVAYDT